MLKVYTEHSILNSGNRSFFFPLLEEMARNENSSVHQYYVFCDTPEAADILILPLFLDHLISKKESGLIDFFKETSLKCNRPLWVFIGGDLPMHFNFENAVVFKQVDFKSRISKNTFITPVFISAPVQSFQNNELITIPKTQKPIIGYVGHAKAGFIKYLRTFYIFLKYNFDVLRKKQIADFGKFYPSSHIRMKYLKILQQSNLLICNFIFRDRYRAGAATAEERKKTASEFFENIQNSHYVFCIRGGGNFSVRLYETLAMGRIPLQIDTDCVLPLEDFIDWNAHAIIIDEKNIHDVPARLNDFHNNISKDDFEQLQKENRLFWEKYLTKANYFNFVHDIVTNKLK